MIKGLVDDSPPVPQDLHEVVSAARENLNLTEEEIARLLGVEAQALDKCLAQPAAAGPEFHDRVHKLWDTAVLMKEVFPDRDAGLAWLSKEKIRWFKGKRPVDLLRQGEIDEVLTALATFYTGAFI
jgi:DNA-binding XRE family transcriptional regulator